MTLLSLNTSSCKLKRICGFCSAVHGKYLVNNDGIEILGRSCDLYFLLVVHLLYCLNCFLHHWLHTHTLHCTWCTVYITKSALCWTETHIHARSLPGAQHTHTHSDTYANTQNCLALGLPRSSDPILLKPVSIASTIISFLLLTRKIW